MRKVKIVADSSANRMKLGEIPFDSAPMKIICGGREFVDDASLNVDEMVEYLSSYKGTSQTSCPNVEDWLRAFDDAEEIYCATISSQLSGSYNSACVARGMYLEEHPDRKVLVIDSISAGPEITLIIEKIEEMILEGKTFEEISDFIPKYQQKTGVLFSLESLNNLASNGRISAAVAKLAGILGIRLVGKGSDVGTLEPINKCRGEKKALAALFKTVKEHGLKTGRVIISHCNNENASNELKKMILSELKDVTVRIENNMGLCSYYAERGGLIVGYEKY